MSARVEIQSMDTRENRMMRMPLLLTVALGASLVACKAEPEQHLDVTVAWSEVKQTMDGFGASSAFFGGNITDELADQLFDAKKGIGLSLLRIMIGLPGDIQNDGSEPTDGPKPVATAPELTTAQQALTRGAKVWATAWTPPPIWKTTNNKNGSGDSFKSNKLQTSHYQDYADYLADFVDLAGKAGVPLMAVSPANEPDYIASWDGAQWSAEDLTTFVGQYLGPTFERRCSSVKIVTPDTASWPNVDSYLSKLLADGNAKKYLSVVATHPYQNGDAPIVLDYRKPADNQKAFWETEWSQENKDGDTPDPSMVSAIDMVKRMHDHLTVSNMSAWNWWAIYISPDALKNADEKKIRQNPALIQPDKSMSSSYMFKRGYALGNWAKFVRPGFQRIAATDHPTGGVLIEAYRDSSHIALIAINTNGSTVTQKFSIDGGSFGTLTPWVTSPNDKLEAKSRIDAGDSFSFDLPGQSVVTFVNWDATSETPNQGTLPVLKQDAGTDVKTSTGGLDCSSAIVPNNLGNGGVTDFSDWNSNTWGSSGSLSGYRYPYAGPKGSSMSATPDSSAKNMRIKGTVMPGDYGGAGLSFLACVTVESFSKIEFNLSGSAPGCDMELQIKTFEQQPIDQNPAGGCYQDASASCYRFPAVSKVAVPSTDVTTVTTPLDSFSGWGADKATQVVGLQWHFTGSNLDPDAGAGCPIDVTVSDIKFVP
jgi:glucuronoarabinoxylan endo-1,4-beta-xylanase